MSEPDKLEKDGDSWIAYENWAGYPENCIVGMGYTEEEALEDYYRNMREKDSG